MCIIAFLNHFLPFWMVTKMVKNDLNCRIFHTPPCDPSYRLSKVYLSQITFVKRGFTVGSSKCTGGS